MRSLGFERRDLNSVHMTYYGSDGRLVPSVATFIALDVRYSNDPLYLLGKSFG